ncbi:hypothetical protein [Saccharibacter sp. 17.LH.SD]|uniref:hypothetical protein n=1 Tax=Saccharibacter sp. 17.LH.SD TaxID=2689393 RepID=UPI001F2DCD3C|nr:hypothetical protein [Saccharibacter sp. 17.LH.SD]
MDFEKISENYTQFRSTAEQAFQLLDGLIGKMQGAADNGDSQAGEWVNELKKAADLFQGSQGNIGELLQNVHGVMSLLGQNNSENKEGGENNATTNVVSNFLNSDLGKSFASGTAEKIGGGFLSKLFK